MKKESEVFESSGIDMKVVETPHMGRGVVAFIANDSVRESLEGSQSKWVDVGCFNPSKLSHSPLSTPFFNEREYEGAFIDPLTTIKIGDHGKGLGVFANHTSFFPNAVVYDNPKGEARLYARKDSVLKGEELFWTYGVHHFRIEKSWFPREEDIKLIHEDSFWHDLIKNYFNKDVNIISQSYQEQLATNVEQYTWGKLYLETINLDLEQHQYLKRFLNACEVIRERKKNCSENPDIKEVVLKLKQHPDYTKLIQTKAWQTMFDYLYHPRFKEISVSGVMHNQINHLVNTLIRAWMISPSKERVHQNMLENLVEQLKQEMAWVITQPPEQGSGFIQLELIDIVELIIQRHPQKERLKSELADIKQTLLDQEGRISKNLSMVYQPLLRLFKHQTVPCGLRQGDYIGVYINTVFAVKKSCSGPGGFGLAEIDYSHGNTRHIPNDDYYGAFHQFDCLDQRLIMPKHTMNQVVRWLSNHVEQIPSFVEKIRNKDLITSNQPLRGELINGLIQAVYHQSHLFLYVYRWAKKNKKVASAFQSIQAHWLNHPCSERALSDKEAMSRVLMMLHPGFDWLIDSFDWEKLYEWSMVQTKGKQQLVNKSLVVPLWTISLFTPVAQTPSSCVSTNRHDGS